MEKILLNADNGQVLVMGDWYVKVQYTVLATFLDFYLFIFLVSPCLSVQVFIPNQLPQKSWRLWNKQM